MRLRIRDEEKGSDSRRANWPNIVTGGDVSSRIGLDGTSLIKDFKQTNLGVLTLSKIPLVF